MEDPKELANTLLARAKQAESRSSSRSPAPPALMSQVLADAEGPRNTFHGGFVTYTKEQKTRALGVPAAVLREQGAVNVRLSRAQWRKARFPIFPPASSAAITGVAGPEAG